MKTINVEADEKTGECYLKLTDFEHFIDISKVVSYEFDFLPDNKLTIKFYDSNNQLIEPKK